MGADTEDPPAGGTTTKAPAVSAGQAVRFRFHDPVFGTELDTAGIVVAADGEVVAVAPVQPFTVNAAAADVTPLT